MGKSMFYWALEFYGFKWFIVLNSLKPGSTPRKDPWGWLFQHFLLFSSSSPPAPSLPIPSSLPTISLFLFVLFCCWCCEPSLWQLSHLSSPISISCIQVSLTLSRPGTDYVPGSDLEQLTFMPILVLLFVVQLGIKLKVVPTGLHLKLFHSQVHEKDQFWVFSGGILCFSVKSFHICLLFTLSVCAVHYVSLESMSIIYPCYRLYQHSSVQKVICTGLFSVF